MIVDLCGGGSLEDQPSTTKKNSVHDANFTTSTFSSSSTDAYSCRGSAKLPRGASLLNVGQPLQVGGMAHPAPAHALYGWPEPLLPLPLHGCVRNLRINGQVGDQSGVVPSSSIVELWSLVSNITGLGPYRPLRLRLHTLALVT